MKLNPPSMTDFYKTGHRSQYPEGTELVYSNATCRGDKHFKGLPDFEHKVVNFGMQGICQWMLIDLWNANFFSKPKNQAVNRHKRTVERALGIKDFDVSHIEALHDLGYLPVVIKSLPEGSRVNIKVPTYTITNTKPEFFWLTNYLETQIQAESWKCKVSATTAYEFRRLFERYADMTGVDKSFVDFQGHDFSMRGMSGIQDATQCGAGHLLSFKGTDTISAIEYLEDYYMGLGALIFTDDSHETMRELDDRIGDLYDKGVRKIVYLDDGEEQYFDIVPNGKTGKHAYKYDLVDIEHTPSQIGSSVPATEHAVSSMNGKEGELEFFRRFINKVYPTGIVSLVSDTYDFWRAITEHMVTLKDEIMARDGKVVIRPDSGDPVDIICGTAIPITKKMLEDQDWEYFDVTAALVYAEDNKFDIFNYNGKFYEYRARGFGSPYVEVQSTPEMKGAVECLWDVFGGTTTGKGFKTLDSHIGLIYGDSINLDRAQQILQRLADKGFSSANIVFGIGSFTYQFVTRDTFSEAVKATFGIVNGEPREIFKDPKTGDGGKKSAKGLIRVEREGNDFVLYDQQTWEQEAQGELKELFRDGKMMRLDSHQTIKERLLGEQI